MNSSIFKIYKISVIIPNFNWGRFIEGCIKSILAQAYDNYEIIIIDGKSTDNSHEIIKKYTWISNKIKWLDVLDIWISNGFNIWIKESKGDFVLLLWSDDYVYENIFLKLNQYINNINNFWYIDIKKCNVFCDSINYWSLKNQFIKRKPQTSLFTKNNLIRFWNIVWFQNIFINRWWFENHTINEENKYSMDFESYFEMIQNDQIFVYLPEINSINCLWDNTTCKYWYQSQKEANKISMKYANKITDYIFIFKRFITRELMRIAYFLAIIK